MITILQTSSDDFLKQISYLSAHTSKLIIVYVVINLVCICHIDFCHYNFSVSLELVRKVHCSWQTIYVMGYLNKRKERKIDSFLSGREGLNESTKILVLLTCNVFWRMFQFKCNIDYGQALKPNINSYFTSSLWHLRTN